MTIGRYRHYKGAEYQVLGLARHSETEEWLVLYQPCYGEQGYWVRPYTMFTECIMHPDTGCQEPRFALIEASPGDDVSAENAQA